MLHEGNGAAYQVMEIGKNVLNSSPRDFFRISYLCLIEVSYGHKLSNVP